MVGAPVEDSVLGGGWELSEDVLRVACQIASTAQAVPLVQVA